MTHSISLWETEELRQNTSHGIITHSAAQISFWQYVLKWWSSLLHWLLCVTIYYKEIKVFTDLCLETGVEYFFQTQVQAFINIVPEFGMEHSCVCMLLSSSQPIKDVNTHWKKKQNIKGGGGGGDPFS